MPKPKDEKTERLSIRVTAFQMDRWKEAAAAARREFPDWVRLALEDMATAELQGDKGKKR